MKHEFEKKKSDLELENLVGDKKETYNWRYTETILP